MINFLSCCFHWRLPIQLLLLAVRDPDVLCSQAVEFDLNGDNILSLGTCTRACTPHALVCLVCEGMHVNSALSFNYKDDGNSIIALPCHLDMKHHGFKRAQALHGTSDQSTGILSY